MFTIMGAAAACATDKDEAKGVVDDSEPPSIPAELSKADSSSKEVAVNVQSAHPYTNNLNKVFSVPTTGLPSCANQVRLHFKVLRTEAGYDYVTVEPSPDPKQRFDGDRDDTWTNWFAKTGTSVPVRLESDSSITRHGFEIDKLEWAGAAICPAIAYPACAAGTIDITPPLAACACPGPKQCAAQTTAEVSHLIARGRNRVAHAVKGNVASETHPGPTDAPVTSVIGTLDQTKVNSLIKRASQLGLLHGPGYERTVAPGAAYEDFTIKAGTKTVTFIATEGAQDAAVAQLIADFEALFLCGTPTGGLSCGTGFTCSDDGACNPEPQGCVCAEIYQPVCSESSTTFGNQCEADCAGVNVVHTGRARRVGVQHEQVLVAGGRAVEAGDRLDVRDGAPVRVVDERVEGADASERRAGDAARRDGHVLARGELRLPRGVELGEQRVEAREALHRHDAAGRDRRVRGSLPLPPLRLG